MSMQTVSVRLSSHEVAILDELRGGLSRSAFIRIVVRRAGPVQEVLTHEAVLGLLSAYALSGSTSAAVSLERALRPTTSQHAGIDEAIDRILRKGGG